MGAGDKWFRTLLSWVGWLMNGCGSLDQLHNFSGVLDVLVQRPDKLVAHECVPGEEGEHLQGLRL